MLHCSDKKNILILFLFVSSIVFGQGLTSEDKKQWFEADKLVAYGDYLNAEKIYAKLLEKDSTLEDVNYKIALCYFNLPDKREASLHYFQKVNDKQYIENNFYQGRLLHLNRDYKAAIRKYETYMKTREFDRVFSDKTVKDLILKSRTALLYEKEDRKDIQLKNLGELVNSNYADYAPKISAEGHFLYFTSRRENKLWDRKDAYGNYLENIFYSEFDTIWNRPEILDTTINSDFNDACTGISSDGEKMLLFRTSKDLISGNIYESILTNDKWSTPLKLDNSINSEDNIETSACYSIDGNSIYFSSDRPGGFGGKDLYVVKKLPTGSWGEAYNLGPEINTPYDETSPFVHPSGTKLFFSSKGHENMGGYDIFVSNFDQYGHYDAPDNLKYPINTNDDDLFFVLTTNEEIGYLSSKRKGGFGSYDIYEVKMPSAKTSNKVYKINLYDDDNQPIKKFNVRLIDLNTKTLVGKYKSNGSTGKMIIISEPNTEYEISIEAKGYTSYRSQIILNANYFLTFMLTSE